jgi:aminopeptidase YwaD
MSPFPLIDEPRFAAATAYLPAEAGVELARHAGETATVRIDSECVASSGVQPIGRLGGEGSRRVIVGAHVDTKPETPGALDNAAGVATILAVAELLASGPILHTVEIVAFNGEDHATSAGEVAYLEANPDLSDVALMVNVDGAGILGGPSAYSTYGVGEATTSLLQRLAAENPAITGGPTWPSSDHMIFAMRGVPSVALTSADIDAFFNDIAHTPTDTPDKVDEHVLASTARFIAELITQLPAG